MIAGRKNNNGGKNVGGKTPGGKNNVGGKTPGGKNNVGGKNPPSFHSGRKKPRCRSASLRSAIKAFGLASLGLNGNSACRCRGAGGWESMLVACPPPCLSLARRASGPRCSLSARPRGIAASRPLSRGGFAAIFSPSRRDRSRCSLRDIEQFAFSGFGSWFRLCRVCRLSRPDASAYEANALTGRLEARAGASAGGEGRSATSGTSCRIIFEPPAAPPSEAPYSGSNLDL